MKVRKQDPRFFDFFEKLNHQVNGNQSDQLEKEIRYLEERIEELTSIPQEGDFEDNIPNPTITPAVPVNLSEPLKLSEITRRGLGVLDVEVDRTPLDPWTSDRGVGEHGGADSERLLTSAIRQASSYRPTIPNDISPIQYKNPLWPRTKAEWKAFIFPPVPDGRPEFFPFMQRDFRNWAVWRISKAIFGRLIKSDPAIMPNEDDVTQMHRWLLQRNFMPNDLVTNFKRDFLPAYLNAFNNCDLEFIRRTTDEELTKHVAFYMTKFMNRGLYNAEEYMKIGRVTVAGYNFDPVYRVVMFRFHFSFKWRRVIKQIEDPEDPVPRYFLDPEDSRFHPNQPGKKDYLMWEGDEVMPTRVNSISMYASYSEETGFIVESLPKHFIGIMRYINQVEFNRANRIDEPVYGLRGQKKFDLLDRVAEARDRFDKKFRQQAADLRHLVLDEMASRAEPRAIADEDSKLVEERKKAEEEIRNILREEGINVHDDTSIDVTVPPYTREDLARDLKESEPDDQWDGSAFYEPFFSPPPFKPLFDEMGRPIIENQPGGDPYKNNDQDGSHDGKQDGNHKHDGSSSHEKEEPKK